MGRSRYIKINLFILGSLLTLSGCLPADFHASSGGKKTSIYDVNMYPVNKTVCDPLDPSQNPNPSIYGGLKADLYYRGKDQPRYYSSKDYIEKTKKSSKFFFFTDLNVPTRLFDTGFPLQAGGMIQNDEGEDLVEYFALRFTTIMKLSPNDSEGEYELALLSDDGSTLRVRQQDGIYKTYVDNEGDHPTKLACGAETIHMTKDSEIVVQLDYYQGPRYHISLIPLWRKVDDGQRKSESLCGASGNDTWFDSNNNSKPTQNYNALIARGWKPIAPANYEIPNTYYYNPCVQGVAPKITNFHAQIEDGMIHAWWTTDIPATSQVRTIHSASREDWLSVSDNILTTDHDIYIRPSQKGEYYVQGVSISESLGKAMSGFVQLVVE